LSAVARSCHRNLISLMKKLADIEGARARFSGPVFHELVVELDKPAELVLDRMATEKILGGYSLARSFPGMENCILVNVTETKTDADIDIFSNSLKGALE
jgi:glycine dehydrogenase subunit 1